MIERNKRGALRATFGDPAFLLGTPLRTALVLVLVNVAIGFHQASLTEARRAILLAAPPPTPAAAAAVAPRYDLSIGDNVGKYLPSIPDARKSRLAILSGMSQMYAINERKPGDETISEYLDDSLRASGTRVFGLAGPNLDNEEALFLLLATLSRPETKPAVFIYGLCFDKMRFVDLRPGYLSFLREHDDARRLMAQTAERYSKRFPLASGKLRETLASLDANPAQEEKSVEHRIREDVGEAVPMVGSRKDLNTYLLYNVLYAARNKILGIRSTSKRPMIEGRYDLNKEFLLMMFDVSASNGVKFVAYINPLNPQAENPYVPAEYDAFKTWARHVTDSAGVPFANLENAVRREDWGLLNGEADFMHFKGEGHLATARALDSVFHRELVGTAGSPGQ